MTTRDSSYTGSTSGRREFLSTALAGAALSVGAVLPRPGHSEETSAEKSSKKLHVKPRYHRWHVDPGVEWIEKNTSYAFLDWQIPLASTALVLVDVWDHHYLKDAEARAEVIINEKFMPLLAGCRRAGMTIIHAPSPAQAKGHPNWVGAAPAATRPASTDSTWPPAAFRNKSGEFATFGRPEEPRESELVVLRANRQIHPKVLPVGDEPVVATGAELHETCRRRGILFLFYAGFNTNACILGRDYGTIEMGERGYEIILLRDCTTGMESCETQSALGQTNGAILYLEMFGKYSITSDELLAGISE